MAECPPVHGERWKLLSPSNDGYGIGRAVWAAPLARLHVLDNSGWNTFGVRDAISGPESGVLFKRFLCCILHRQTFPEQNTGFTVAFPSCVSCSFFVRPFRVVPSSHPLPKQFSLYSLMEEKPCSICLSASGWFHSSWCSLVPSISLQMTSFNFFFMAE